MTIETPDPKPDRMAKARAAKKLKAATKPAESEDPDVLRAQLARIQEKLADERQTIPTGAEPGTVIKDGLGPDKIPWTPAVLRDYCNRGVTIDGVKFEWKSIIGVSDRPTVSWNGIVYRLFTGIENKIPSVHFAVYMQSLDDQRREAAKWEPPDHIIPRDGYQSEPHIMGVGPLEPRGE